ncbi:hypothetical protein AX16_007675 [Volvariella volvacea WC 439]|nr:hypothetical protein AX16_007675 [Volvariella volvacea WC 439]
MDPSSSEKVDATPYDKKHASEDAAPTISKDKRKEYLDKLTFVDLGVWRIWFDKAAQASKSGKLRFDVHTARRFLSDMYKLNPSIFIMLVLGKIWDGVERVVLLFFSSKLLGMIETGLKTGKPDTSGILRAALKRLLIVVVAATFRWWCGRVQSRMHNEISLFYENMILSSKLKKNVAAAKDDDTVAWNLMGTSATRTWESLTSLSTKIFSITSQVGFLIHMATSNSGGPLFVVCCVARPLITFLSQKSLWDVAHVVEANDPNYIRLKALKRIVAGEYREEVVSGNLIDWIRRELNRTLAALTRTSMDYPDTLYSKRNSPLQDIISAITEDLPILYYAANAILDPMKLSLTSIAMLEQTSQTMRWALEGLTYELEGTRGHLNELKSVYEAESKVVEMKGGNLPHPAPASQAVAEKVRYPGMKFELKNVTFNYPGSKATTHALNNISCTIKAGQLAVIVGANGSGKSTLIKLLARLYDPSEGEILLDGHNIAQYRLSDLRRSVAMLTQDHHIFPFSLGENIAMGHWENFDTPSEIDYKMVEKAVKDGGALELMKKFEDGYRTNLEPMYGHYGVHVSEQDDGLLAAKLKDCDKVASVSGGERQRIMASRTFMRMQSDKITFLAVDEPSSALDPEGELQLFNNLRSQRDGRTVVFVTHRFGHLTKHADLIMRVLTILPTELGCCI